MCYFKALQIGNVNKVTPIDKSSTILTIIFAVLFLGEKVSVAKFFWVVVLAIGTYLMIDRKKEVIGEKTDRTWLIFALLSAFFAALGAIFAKIGISQC